MAVLKMEASSREGGSTLRDQATWPLLSRQGSGFPSSLWGGTKEASGSGTGRLCKVHSPSVTIRKGSRRNWSSTLKVQMKVF